jgi:hypothetical protein
MSDERQKVDRLRDISYALLAEMDKLKALEQEGVANTGARLRSLIQAT